MNLEDQVCSLELSKKLKELGVEQKSLFYWNTGKDINEEGQIIDRIGLVFYEINQINFISYSAFTSDELFELLPAWIDTKTNEPFNNFYLQIKKRTAENIKYIATYICDSMPGEEASNPLYQLQSCFTTHSSKLADCLAEMLILIKEQGLK